VLGNLGGWHLLVILGVLVITIAIVAVAVVIIAVQLSRSSARDGASATPDPVGQIMRLAQLRDEGLLSDAEYEAKRIEILGRI
jgi:hypothetical protein